jgi:hypothetical protein
MSELSASSHLFLVFSEPPEDVSDETFCDWYENHVAEILETPGFESAQRYRLNLVGAAVADPPTSRYLVVWEISKDIKSLQAELARRSEAGEIVLPAWFADVRYFTWTCEPVGERSVRTGEQPPTR